MITVESGNATGTTERSGEIILLTIESDSSQGRIRLDTDLTERQAAQLVVSLVHSLGSRQGELLRLMEGMRDP